MSFDEEHRDAHELCTHEINALRDQLRASPEAAKIAFDRGFERARQLAVDTASRMAGMAREISHKDRECERMHLHAAVACEALMHQIMAIKSDEAKT